MCKNTANMSVSVHRYTSTPLSSPDTDDEPLKKRTRLSPLESTKWHPFTVLPPNAHGYLLGICNAIECDEEKIDSGIFEGLRYVINPEEDAEYIHVPLLELNISDTPDSELAPFGKDEPKSENVDNVQDEYAPDMMAVMMTSKKLAFNVKVPRTGGMESFKKVLMKDLKFEKAALRGLRTTLFHRGSRNIELAGIMLDAKRSADEYLVTVYGRDLLHIETLINSMYAVLPEKSVIYLNDTARATASDCHNAVRNVITFVEREMKRWVVNDGPNAVIPRAKYEEFCDKLSEMEWKTARLFERARSDG